jgi:transcriptional regulator with XRE-family HTH domain
MAKTTADGKSRANAAFGRTLYALRIEKGYSQEELSFRCEIDRSYVSQLERGEKEPCLGILVKLSEGLGTALSELFRRFEIDGGRPSTTVARNARVR